MAGAAPLLVLAPRPPAKIPWNQHTYRACSLDPSRNCDKISALSGTVRYGTVRIESAASPLAPSIHETTPQRLRHRRFPTLPQPRQRRPKRTQCPPGRNGVGGGGWGAGWHRHRQPIKQQHVFTAANREERLTDVANQSKTTRDSRWTGTGAVQALCQSRKNPGLAPYPAARHLALLGYRSRMDENNKGGLLAFHTTALPCPSCIPPREYMR